MDQKTLRMELEEIKEKTLYVTDSVDGKVDAFLELEDYERLVAMIEKLIK